MLNCISVTSTTKWPVNQFNFCSMLQLFGQFFRSNLKGLYRGDVYNVYNCQRSIRASRSTLVCWMGYTSFTAAHICIGTNVHFSCDKPNSLPRAWFHVNALCVQQKTGCLDLTSPPPAGMIIQTLVFFLCLLIAVFLIIIPILQRQNLILFQILWSMWWASPTS